MGRNLRVPPHFLFGLQQTCLTSPERSGVNEGILASLVCGLLLVFAPGRAWGPILAPSANRLLAGLALSAATTTFIGLGLGAAGIFRVSTLGWASAGVTLAGMIASWRLAGAHKEREALPAGLWPCAGVFALSLFCFWPPYPTLLAAQDSSAYLALGRHLNQTGAFSKSDEISRFASNFL